MVACLSGAWPLGAVPNGPDQGCTAGDPALPEVASKRIAIPCALSQRLGCLGYVSPIPQSFARKSSTSV